MNRLIQAASSSVDQAELFSLLRKSAYVSFAEGSLDLVAHRNQATCALRVLMDGRMGASYGESPSQDGLLEDAIATASFGKPVPYGFSADRPSGIPHSHNPKTADLSAEELVDVCSELKARVTKKLPDAVVNMTCEAESGVRRLETSAEGAAEEAYSRVSLSVQIPFSAHSTGIGAYSRILSCDPLTVSDDWVEGLLEMRSWGAQASAPASGRLPVLLTPFASSLLTMTLSACLAGHVVAPGISPLSDKRGQQILSKHLTLREDPQRVGFPYARSFDDEGVACQPRTLVEKGVLRGFITDLRGASALGESPTGNAVRRTMFSEKIEDAPIASLLGAMIEPGSVSWRQLLSSMDEGILVTRMMGLHSSNLLQGQFAVQAQGFHVRNGKVIGHLEKTMMAGNVFEDFLDVAAVSREGEWTCQEPMAVAGWAPYILLNRVQLTRG